MLNLEKIQTVLGVNVEEVLGKAQDSIKAFAKVSYKGVQGQLLIASSELLGTDNDVYAIYTNNTITSNTSDTNAITLKLVAYFLENGMDLDKLDSVEVLKEVKSLIRSINNESINEEVLYVKDNEVLTTYIGQEFKNYITDANVLQNIVPIKLEEQHIAYFKRLSEMKKVVSINTPKVSSSNDLKERLGIFISHNNYLALTDAIKMRENILMSGPTGTGKTKIAKTILKDMGVPFEFIEGSQEKRYSDIIIATTLDENNKLTTSLGKALICYTKGYPLLMDEFTALGDNIYKAILSLIQEDEVSVEVDTRNEDGEMVRSLTFQRHPDFFVIATANEEKRYNVNVLTPQVKRRFQTILTINYLTPDEEIEFVNEQLEKSNITFDEVAKYVEIANILRANKLTVSTSTVAYWAKKSATLGIQIGTEVSLVPQICFTQQELKTVNDIICSHLNIAPVKLFI